MTYEAVARDTPFAVGVIKFLIEDAVEQYKKTDPDFISKLRARSGRDVSVYT